MLHQIDIMCYTILNHSWYYVYSFLNQVRNLRKTFKDTSTIIFKHIFLLQIQYHWQYLKRQSLLRFYHSIPHQILTLGYLQWDWRNLGKEFNRFSGPWMDVRMSMVSTWLKFANFPLWLYFKYSSITLCLCKHIFTIFRYGFYESLLNKTFRHAINCYPEPECFWDQKFNGSQ